MPTEYKPAFDDFDDKDLPANYKRCEVCHRVYERLKVKKKRTNGVQIEYESKSRWVGRRSCGHKQCAYQVRKPNPINSSWRFKRDDPEKQPLRYHAPNPDELTDEERKDRFERFKKGSLKGDLKGSLK